MKYYLSLLLIVVGAAHFSQAQQLSYDYGVESISFDRPLAKTNIGIRIKFLQVLFDVTNAQDYAVLGAQQMLSLPFSTGELISATPINGNQTRPNYV